MFSIETLLCEAQNVHSQAELFINSLSTMDTCESLVLTISPPLLFLTMLLSNLTLLPNTLIRAGWSSCSVTVLSQKVVHVIFISLLFSTCIILPLRVTNLLFTSTRIVSEITIMGSLYLESLFTDAKVQFLTVALVLLKLSIVCQSSIRELVKLQLSIVMFNNLVLILWQPIMFSLKGVALPQCQDPSPLLLMSLYFSASCRVKLFEQVNVSLGAELSVLAIVH